MIGKAGESLRLYLKNKTKQQIFAKRHKRTPRLAGNTGEAPRPDLPSWMQTEP